ncbi:putative bifunctional diguanylate cyclase/phosphodiesterase [Rhodoluna limnophila]|uniref:putative bifunctional diguanylate cyclase/phosphodiesterase n=1 Tax=Rhodoluna limnophila TaxID=232537 RepID=UPI0011071511|nr:GGDEF and EAL domain-containing protein [Rhodoluna limnophila]
MSESTKAKPNAKKNIFRVKVGHVLLGLIAFGSLVGLMLYSLTALSAHELDKRALLNQEGDASAMTFVQRESFNVLLDFHEWTTGEMSAREVQISRAMLGQRLSVVTESGLATFDLTEDGYRDALVELDQIIMQIADVPDAERVEFEQGIEDKLDNFASETRYLSQTFEALTEAQTEATVAERVQAEVIQAVLLAIGMVAGGALGAWVTIDIVRGFRTVLRKIQQQRENLEWTRNRLLLVQKVDEKCRELIRSIHTGKPTEVLLAELKDYLFSLATDLWLDVEIDNGEITKFELIKDPSSDISDEDREFMHHRMNEVLQAALSRDVQDQVLTFEREYDNLTGLPNRNLFTATIETKVRESSNSDVVAIMLIDIDRFRDVNGSLGYEAGDVLLREVANHLGRFKSGNEHAARLSGDEFGFAGVFESREAAAARAAELIEDLKFSTTLAGLDSVVTSSVGVAISEPGSADATELARCASLAIYLAKAEGERSGFTIFSPTEHEAMLTTWQEEIAVRNALRSGEFVMHFQPIVSLETHKPVGVEALIRWERPGHGLVPPDQFLPIVNRAGLTAELGSEVLRESLATWSRTISRVFTKLDLPTPYVSINVEVAQLEDPSFVQFVLTQAANAHVPTTAIVLEVTEHTLAAGDVVLGQLQRLREAGVRIALDDFGTGYSNLGQAQKMPLDILKIDKSFLEAVDTDDRSHRMVSDVTNMAKGQNLKVTAEGIESQLVAELLAGMTVDYGQGYHFSKALPEADLERWLDNFS